MKVRELFNAHFKTNKLLYTVWVLCVILVAVIGKVVLTDAVRKLISSGTDGNMSRVFSIFFYMAVIVAVMILARLLREKEWFRLYSSWLNTLEGALIGAKTQDFSRNDADKHISIIRQTAEGTAMRKYARISGGTEVAVLLIALSVYAALIDGYAVIGCYIIAITFMLITAKRMKNMSGHSEAFGDAMNHAYGVSWDQVNHALVASFLRPHKVSAVLDEAIEACRVSQVELNKTHNLVRIFSRFANVLIIMLYFLYITFRARAGQIQFADSIAILIVLPLLVDTIFKIPSLLFEGRAIAGMEKIIDECIDDAGQARAVTSLDGLRSLKVRDLKFSYIPQEAQGGRSTLSIDSLDVAYGEPLFVVGASGSGKSTFLKLCAGRLSPDAGSIDWDGVQAARVRNELMHEVLLLNESICITDTLIHNILLSDDAPDMIKLKRVLKEVFLEERFQDERQAADISIDPSHLSMGEKQKLSLARALYHDHKHWLLDEATSALDIKSEGEIIERIRTRATRNEGVLIIATHRINNILSGDNVVFINGQGGCDIGKHEVLLRDSGRYRMFIERIAEGA